MKRFFEISAVVLIVVLMIAAACTERIDIKTNDAPPRLVIYGYISSDTMQHSIRITRSAGYFTTGSPEGVSNAAVTFTDNENNVIPLTENDTIPGLYQTAADVYGEEGKSYRLDVFLDSDGENFAGHYTASAYLQHIHHIDSIDLRTSDLPLFKNSVLVVLYAWNFGEDNTYSIFVAINDSVVNSSINRFIVMEGSMFRELYIDQPCYFLNQDPNSEYRNEILHVGDKVTLNINAISKEYAKFISSVQSEVRTSIPIFGGPPANVETNIRCIDPKDGVPVSGFFTAFPSRYAHTWVREEFK